jgi:prolipoprotein diacylglyceryl transferase
VVGARLYHVATNPELYFAPGRDPLRALYIWHGGLGIWGGVAGGALGVFVYARRNDIPFRDLADALAPCLPLAQAIGRFGNWFNQELFGRPTDLPWGLEISPQNRPESYKSSPTFHPTFLYEATWDLALVGVLIWAERRFRLTGGRLFALYVMGYTAGRAWIESLRVDPANMLWGLRLNEWTSLVLFLAGLAYLIVFRRAGTPAAQKTSPVAHVEQADAAEDPRPQ